MCRKNLARLTPAERQAFVNAILTLKNNGGYDTFIDQHAGAGGHGHGGPAFFAWHREFVLRYEQALQDIDSSVHLPYWDWSVDNLNSAGTESLIWRDDFMGGPGVQANNFRVTTGPFAGWNIRRNAFIIFSSPGFGGQINNYLNNPTYTGFLGLEGGPHGGAHVWVGGDMGSIPSAPRDPTFFLLHCNIDRLWSEWINRHESEPGFEPYEPTSGGPTGHNLNDSMWPWNGTTNPFGVAPWTATPEIRRPVDQIDHRALGYFYDTLDPECAPPVPKRRLPKEIIKERLPKELKERLPKELKERLKERLPKELKEKDRLPKELKERLPKELAPKERAPKELKERSPKELKDIREIPIRRPFIRPDLRPDLDLNALAFEADITETELEELRRALALRAGNLDEE